MISFDGATNLRAKVRAVSQEPIFLEPKISFDEKKTEDHYFVKIPYFRHKNSSTKAKRCPLKLIYQGSTDILYTCVLHVRYPVLLIFSVTTGVLLFFEMSFFWSGDFLEIAQNEGIATNILSDRLNRLEEKGFIRRVANAQDRRSKLIIPTRRRSI